MQDEGQPRPPFHNRLSEWRAQRGDTLQKVADTLEIHVTTASRHESGWRPLPRDMVRAYARYYQVPSAELFVELGTAGG